MNQGTTTLPSNGIAERVFQSVVTESVTEVAKYLPQIGEAAATASEYHLTRGRWPTTKNELTEFAQEHGLQLDLLEFSDLKIVPIGNGERARMTYVIHPKEMKDEIKGEAEIPQSKK